MVPLDRAFLHLLGYMYLQQAKYREALILFRFLRLHFVGDVSVVLSLVYALYQLKRYKEVSSVLDSLDPAKFSDEHRSVYFFLKSKSLWELGQVQESRAMLRRYLECRKLDA
jgi:tetratricopeptide (TPR) repeat protein